MPDLHLTENVLDLPPACARCIECGGLCASCATHDRALLPQLAAFPWAKWIGKAKPIAPPAVVDVVEVPSLGTPGRRAHRKLARAMAGQRTRARA